MKKANNIGNRYICHTTLDGVSVDVFITKEDFDVISQQLVQQKFATDGRDIKWQGSAEIPLYDTPTGGLEEGYYADAEPGFYWTQETGKPLGRVATEYVVGRKIVDVNKVDYGYSI